MTGDQPTLFPLLITHCFFNCGHVVQSHDPDAGHALMEMHYEDAHHAAIDRMTRL